MVTINKKPPVSVKPKALKGLLGFVFNTIPYEIRNKSGDWSPYFGQYEGQKKGDLDTNCCWAFAGNEVLEDSLEFLMKEGYFTKEDIDWFYAKGYIDEDGDFYLSRSFIPKISGVTINGNDEAEYWRFTGKYGAIPNKLLPYTTFYEFFDKSKITQEMYDLGKEFLKRVKIAHEELGGKRFVRRDIAMIKGALLQNELQIGVPTPTFSDWNKKKIKWDGTYNPEHSVAFYKYDEQADYDYPYFIYDQYEPHLKQLSRDYYIPIITRAVVEPVINAKLLSTTQPIQQETIGAKMWKAVMRFLGFFVE